MQYPILWYVGLVHYNLFGIPNNTGAGGRRIGAFGRGACSGTSVAQLLGWSPEPLKECEQSPPLIVNNPPLLS